MKLFELIGHMIFGLFLAALPASAAAHTLDPEAGVGGTVFWVLYLIFVGPCLKWMWQYLNGEGE